MAVPIDALKAIASLFGIVRDGPQQVVPSKPVTFKLIPSSVVDLHATDFVPAGFELTWITKNVLFKDFKIVPAFDASPFVPSSVARSLMKFFRFLPWFATDCFPAAVPIGCPIANRVAQAVARGRRDRRPRRRALLRGARIGA